jgi:ArsR family transcriptional regulator
MRDGVFGFGGFFGLAAHGCVAARRVLTQVCALKVALRLKALADPARGKLCPNSGDLAAGLGLTQISHHLTQLRDAGLAESERRGMNVFHRAHRYALAALCVVLDPNCSS